MDPISASDLVLDNEDSQSVRSTRKLDASAIYRQTAVTDASTPAAAFSRTNSSSTRQYIGTRQVEQPIIKRYELIIRQQPVNGRSCGFASVKDRRMVHPPLILQMVGRTAPESANGSAEISQHELDSSESSSGNIIKFGFPEQFEYLCHISLVGENGDVDKSVALNTRARRTKGKDDENHDAYEQTLIGTTVKPYEFYKDMDETWGYFFIYGDISVRIHGRYRFKCQLLKLDNRKPEDIFQVACIVYTNPFLMYPSKTFPGIQDFTQLSKWFSFQGAPINVRKTYSLDEIMRVTQERSSSSISSNESVEDVPDVEPSAT